MSLHQPIRLLERKKIQHQHPQRRALPHLPPKRPRIIRIRHAIPLLRQPANRIANVILAPLHPEHIRQRIQPDEPMIRRMFLAVQVFVAQRPRVEPLHEVLKDGRARFGEMDNRGGRFQEAVGGVERGGEEGGGGAEEFAVDGEDDPAGADGDVDDGFEELADGDVGTGRRQG